MINDWLAVLLLLALYLGYSTQAVVQSSRRFYNSKVHGLVLALLLLVPFVLVTLPGRASFGPFLNGLGRMALYVAVPAVALLIRPSSKEKSPHWLDVVAVLCLWLPIEFGWLPRAEARLSHSFSVPIPLLTAIVLALVCFLVLRPLPMGYTFRLRGRDFAIAGKALLAFMLIGLPLGFATGFLVFELAAFDGAGWLLALLLGYLFTALPEEILFRGVIQQLIEDQVKRERVALVAASLIFGLAHINNATSGYPVPNWMYVIMATLAGLAYGWAWRKTGKVTVSALVHATVNFIWGVVLGG